MHSDQPSVTPPSVTRPFGDERPAPLVGSPRRRVLTSTFIALTLVAIAVSVMPTSSLRNDALTVARPYLGVTGLDQRWGVFSPDPRRHTGTVLTVVDRADGTSTVLPHYDADGLAEYWDYRRRLLLTQLAASGSPQDHTAYVRWIAERDRGAGHEPVRVSLVRRSAALAGPGPGPDQGPWVDRLIFSARVDR